MIYRTLGKTGIRVSTIGFGTEHLTGPQDELCSIVHEAVDHGVNFFDILLGEPDYYRNYGNAFKSKRDQVVIAGHLDVTKSNFSCREAFGDLLRELQVDHLDVGILQFVDKLDLYQQIAGPGGTLELAQSLKREGKIRSIGMSSHMVPAARQAVRDGAIDVLMFSINPAFDSLPGYIDEFLNLWEWSADPGLITEQTPNGSGRKALYRDCAAAGVGLIAMKPYAAGFLFKPWIYEDGHPMTPVQCLNYALSQPGVSTAIPGISTQEHLREALYTLEASDSELDYSHAIASTKWNITGQCMYCNHCMPCPAGLDIARTLRLIDSALQSGPAHYRTDYHFLPASASDCLNCRQCMDRCPFGVNVAAKMRQGRELFAGI